ncbi:MAG TPA: T9SS type A sorting domain-containing protein [Saprospiraceae bacterium]|nr:T9SS type A sorting domain-containing protein [Saprospiraceae bacterium]
MNKRLISKSLYIQSFTILFLFLSFGGQSQTHTPLVEHFTNSRCPACAAQNVEFYRKLDKYKGQVNPISFYIAVPYRTCELYIASKSGSDARQLLYNIVGTPSAQIDGYSKMQFPTDMAYLDAIRLPAEFSIEFLESSTQKITVRITALNNIDTTTKLNLFIALTEKNVSYVAPNGETTHLNVFRKFAEDNGTSIVFPAGTAKGEEIVKSFDFSYVANWIPNDFNYTAFIQSPLSNQVFESKRTEISNSVAIGFQNKMSLAVDIYPVPAVDRINILIKEPLESLIIRNLTGEIINSWQKRNLIVSDILTYEMVPGIYFLEVISADNLKSATKKFIVN